MGELGPVDKVVALFGTGRAAWLILRPSIELDPVRIEEIPTSIKKHPAPAPAPVYGAG